MGVGAPQRVTVGRIIAGCNVVATLDDGSAAAGTRFGFGFHIQAAKGSECCILQPAEC